MVLLLLSVRVTVPFSGSVDIIQEKVELSISDTVRLKALPIASSQVMESSSSSMVKTNSEFPLVMTGASLASVIVIAKL